MAVLNDYYCRLCDAEATDKWSDDVPICCDEKMRVVLSIKHFEWGSPRQYLHLRDEPFSSRSELNRYAKDKGLSLSASSEKVGGARNDMYEGVGKLYSYKGSPKRGSQLYSEGVRRQ
jgi:hypothetical protein